MDVCTCLWSVSSAEEYTETINGEVLAASECLIDLDTDNLEKHQLVNGSYEDPRCRRDNIWSNFSLCLLAALPVVLLSLCVILFLLSTQLKEFTTDAEYKTDSLDGLVIPMSLSSKMPHPPPVEHGPAVTPPAEPLPPARPSDHLRPQRNSDEDTCTSYTCRFAAQWLQSKLDETKDPCQDFYSYVCGTHRGVSQLSQIAVTIRYLIIRFLNESRIPLTNQAPWQKAAGLYKSCMSLLKNNRNEAEDLVTWMRNMNLDIHNETRIQLVDPIDMIVRCSLDLGVPAILYFQPQDYLFTNKKRVIELRFSGEERSWLKGRTNYPDSFNQDYYAKLLRWYGGKPSSHNNQLASKIVKYEKHLRSIVNDHTIDIPSFVAVGDLHTYTSPYVTKDRWVNAITTYTNGTYTAIDEILVEEPALNILVDALKDQVVGEIGLRYLVAWSIYRQLVRYTVPDLLAKRRPASDACYEHAGKAMHLALMSPYLQGVVKSSMVEAVKTMLSNIRDALHEEFKLSNWVTGEDQTVVVKKLAYMRNFVGSPGQRLENDYLEKLYNSCPDVPLDRLFPSWIKALSLSVRSLWADSRTWRYDETQVKAYYEPSQNALVIPTAIISRPFFYDESSPALNYGSLGTVRQKARQELDDFSDSENIDDFVGVKIAYRAFSSLPYRERRLTLGGLNMSAERLFFIGHCIKWCSEVSNVADHYAPFRSRCVVPIMNMPEFSNAFGCAAGQPMNPKEKCNFWS
ncbi:neprilysin-1-like isoform X3 [Rhipicephalus microplus]|uniref:neprilysin-1-like isoform X3 n=1 Tax=Rhipicephalus microplus TaxID=6941 RepID=UPI003F6ACE27